jgi:hypothetical protein
MGVIVVYETQKVITLLIAAGEGEGEESTA